MLIRRLDKCDEFLAGDKTILRELLHPDKHKADIRYSLAHATVRTGEISKNHSLKNSEVYYIIEGDGIMHIDGEKAKVNAGDAIYIPSGSAQFIENSGHKDLKFLCIVDPAWRAENEESVV